MKTAFDGLDIDENARLSEPVLPQANGGILDLSSPGVTAEGAVKVEIPSYAQPGWGDQVTVIFKDSSQRLVRFAYLPDPTQLENRPYVAEVLVKPLSALASGSYDVEYSVSSRTGNISNSAVSQVQIINSPYAGSGRIATVGTALFGTFVPGMIGSWVVPADYSLSIDSDIVVRSLCEFAPPGGATADVRLTVYQIPPDGQGESQSIAALQSSDGKQWSVSALGKPNIDLHKADLISIELDGPRNARFFVALTL